MAEYYIDREVVRERLYQFIKLPSSSTFWQEINDCINNIPITNVQKVVQSEWNYCNDNTVFCNNCMYEADSDLARNNFKFCPNCGAIMDNDK